jgi:hypothetical protein
VRVRAKPDESNRSHDRDGSVTGDKTAERDRIRKTPEAHAKRGTSIEQGNSTVMYR